MLGATVVFASFTKLLIATDKTSLDDGRAYADFVLGALSAKPLFAFLRLTPMRFWSTLLFLDGRGRRLGRRRRHCDVAAAARAAALTVDFGCRARAHAKTRCDGPNSGWTNCGAHPHTQCMSTLAREYGP